MIPKRIFTIWISELPFPEPWAAFKKTHQIPGYEWKYIDLEEAKHVAYTDQLQYLQEAIDARKWIKVTDYMRMFCLYNQGGIYLDCDMEIVKPNFDDLLDTGMFVGRENPNVIANSIIGAAQFNPLIGKYLEMVEDNFRGSGEFIFEPAERLFTDLVIGKYGNFPDIITYSSDYFFPMDEVTKKVTITPNTHVFHYFNRSWKKEPSWVDKQEPETITPK